MYDEVSFSRDVIARFPSFSQLRESKNQLHLQMGALARAVYDALDRDDLPLAKDVFGFLEHVLQYPRAIPEITAAIMQSFVEPSELLRTDRGRHSLDQMPQRLKQVVRQAGD